MTWPWRPTRTEAIMCCNWRRAGLSEGRQTAQGWVSLLQEVLQLCPLHLVG